MPDSPSERIITEIRRRITSGELSPGDRVPSTRAITQEWGVAMATATRVLTSLRQEGLVRTSPGVGTVVAERQRQATAPALRREPDRPPVRERLIQAAIELADLEGFTSLSMRRVATELDMATMSLYRYVRSKDELLTLMIDAIFGETRFPATPSEGWRPALELVARMQWAAFRRHPWLAGAMSLTRPQPAPNVIAHTEWSLAALNRLGLRPSMAMTLTTLLFCFVRGTAMNWEFEAEARRDTGKSIDEWIDGQAEAYGRLTTSGRFPMFQRVTQDNFDFNLDELFELGLQRLLDGVGIYLDQIVQPV